MIKKKREGKHEKECWLKNGEIDEKQMLLASLLYLLSNRKISRNMILTEPQNCSCPLVSKMTEVQLIKPCVVGTWGRGASTELFREF